MKTNKNFILLLLLLPLLQVGIANAQPQTWDQGTYGVYAHGESLPNVLKNFASNYQLQSVVSAKLIERVNVSIESPRGRDFLNTLNQQYPFIWYYDGSALHFYNVNEIENRVFPLNHVAPSTVLATLKRMNLWDARFHWKSGPNQNMVYVSAPPRLLNLVEQTIQTLDVNTQVEQYAFRIFPLKYANAADSTNENRGAQSTSPGVATMLKRLVGLTGHQTQAISTPQGIKGLRGQGLANNASPQNTGITVIPSATGGVSIEPDMRTNSVIIYDKISRMPIYESAIATLDQPTEQVEIEVSIINISTEKLRNLGVNWQYSSEDASISSGDVSSTSSGIGELSLSSTLSNVGDAILARVDALEQTGDAKIVSRPTVLTADNMQAIIDNSSTFYVRVAGQEEVDLFPVTTGAVLYVTPHILDEEEGRYVDLDIRIEDGQQTDQQVDGIPAISTTSISTEAIVGEHQTLMVGGYYYDTEVETVQRVPGLSRIPLLGRAFKSRSKSVLSMSRIFLIKPRIVKKGHVSQTTYRM